MDAKFVLRAVKAKFYRAAVVPELSINDDSPSRTFARRIDALIFQSGKLTAIEIKTSRADFLRDTPEKREPWRRVVHRFVYVVPQGLNVRDIVPDGCGLWEVTARGQVVVTKRAVIQSHPAPLPMDVVQRLAYRASGSRF